MDEQFLSLQCQYTTGKQSWQQIQVRIVLGKFQCHLFSFSKINKRFNQADFKSKQITNTQFLFLVKLNAFSLLHSDDKKL